MKKENNKEKLIILAIESSCDETAAAVIEKRGRRTTILSNVIASQIDIHKEFGGVFPEKASRAHAEKIVAVVEEALETAEDLSFCETGVSRTEPETRLVRDPESKKIHRGKLIDPDLIAVTSGPGLIGSLLIGVNFAKTYAFAKNKPIIGINHWLGHMYSNWAEEPFPQFPALFLIVSGGHTGLVLMEDYDKVIPLGETLDDAAGEAFDKVSNLLGLGYPGGPLISKKAEERVKNQELGIKLPRPMIDSKNYNFSFSGLKTAVLNEVRKLQAQGLNIEDYQAEVAAEFQQAVIDTLISKTIKAAYQYQPKSICLCGGVSANNNLRTQTKAAVEKLPWKATYHIPPIIMSTDNAAMIGLAAAYQKKSKWTTFENINANSNLKF